MRSVIGGGESKDVQFAEWQSFWAYSTAVRQRRRYVWSKDVQSFLEAVRHTAKKREFTIGKNTRFFRAQVGWEHEVKELEDGNLVGPTAFGPTRMKPLAKRVAEGRANAAGIPVLYLAVDLETAVAEARPWIGSQVSVSQFFTIRELKALDLTQEFGKFWMPKFSAGESKFLPVNAKEKEKSVWTSIDNAFSRPVSRGDDSTEYVPTQILAELFRDDGYDAIVYRSRFGENGYNVVIFDPADADPLNGAPFEVRKIDVVAEQVGNPWGTNRQQERRASGERSQN